MPPEHQVGSSNLSGRAIGLVCAIGFHDQCVNRPEFNPRAGSDRMNATQGSDQERRLGWKELLICALLSALAVGIEIAFSRRIGLLTIPPEQDGVNYMAG